MLEFMGEFEPKKSKSLLAKILGKLRKRDEKAKAKAVLNIIEEPLSDFDY